MDAERRACKRCEKEFVIDADDFVFYEKMDVPPPTWCPDCRAIRRMVFLNQSNLYRKKDARTGKEIFSTYPEKADIKIYEHDYWWSDAWNPMEYGMEVDFTRPFLEQVKELSFAVPWPSRSVRGMVNSDYSNQASSLKNCYLCFVGNDSENCSYCCLFNNLKDTLDAYASVYLELCYEMFDAGECFQCFFSSDINECMNSWFLSECSNCKDCVGCTELKNKKYCIFNEQLSKEEYEKKLKELDIGSYAAMQKVKKRHAELCMSIPHKYMHGLRNVNVMGDYIYESKNSHYVYEVGGLENVKYSECLGAGGAKDSYDYTDWGEKSELVYESISCGEQCRNIKFCFDCWPAMRDSEYCMKCHASSDLFGCVGLNKKQYCILNKQYSKEEYEELRRKIVEHMKQMPYMDKGSIAYPYGEFFPPEFSPLAYNETSVMDYYPKTAEEAGRAGYMWREPEEKEYNITITANDLPDHINDAPDSIAQEIIGCADCGRAYRILEQELAFYKRFTIPLPRMCHRCRFKARLAKRNPRALYERKCMCAGKMSENGVYTNTAAHQSHNNDSPCPNEFKTTYSPDRKEIVYCEQCYNAEVA